MKRAWTHFCEICLLLPLSLRHPTVITPHPQSIEQIRKERLVRHVSPFACNKIIILPTKCARCVLINHASTGFFNAFSLEHFPLLIYKGPGWWLSLKQNKPASKQNQLTDSSERCYLSLKDNQGCQAKTTNSLHTLPYK